MPRAVSSRPRRRRPQPRHDQEEGPPVMSDQSDFEARLERLIHEELTRRRMLKQGAAGALSLSAIAWLAACGGGNSLGGGKAQSKVIPNGKIASNLHFSNWPDYIDTRSPDKGTFG